MKKLIGITLFFLLLVGIGFWLINTSSLNSPSHDNNVLDISKQNISNNIAKLSIPFILNEGQMDEQVKFYANTFAGTVFITKAGQITYELTKSEGNSKSSLLNDQDSPSQVISITEEIVGRDVQDISGEEKSVTEINIFHGNNVSKWRTKIPSYNSLSWGEIYDGIELKLKAYGNNVEKLFFVQKGADPEQIKVKFSGSEKLSVSPEGALVVETRLGIVKFSKPIAFQEIEGKNEFVEVAYAIDDHQYGFLVEEYDQTKELVIDPFLAGTYLGGSGSDAAMGVTSDSEGNIYVTGRAGSLSTDFPGVTGDAPDSTLVLSEAYIVKIDNNLNSILSATFLGGDGIESGEAIVVNESGEVYVVGLTESDNFPGISGSSPDSIFEDREAFVVKLNPDLSQIISATYLGGGGLDQASSVFIDSVDNLFVAGSTMSGSFPGVGPGSAQIGLSGDADAFVAKLDPNLANILAATYVGGFGSDGIGFPFSKVDMSMGDNNTVYITGTSTVLSGSTSFPEVDETSADDDFGGLSEAFVARLDSSLTQILDATFLGGSTGDFGLAITVDKLGNVYAGGMTNSSDFPGITASSLDNNLGQGDNEGFVVKLDPTLSTIQAATYLGGGEDFEFVSSLHSVTLGILYATGRGAPGFPGVDGGSADNNAVGGEAFVANLNGLLSGIDATFIGGSKLDIGNDVEFDTFGNGVMVAGLTDSSPFPAVGPSSADSTIGGNEESFVVKLGDFDNPFNSGMNLLLAEIDRCRGCPPRILDILSRIINVAIDELLLGNIFGAFTTMQNFISETETFIRSGELPRDVEREFREFIALAQTIAFDMSLTFNTQCSTLGDNRFRFFPDFDRFVFDGNKNETVTVILDMDPDGEGEGDRATLFLTKFGQGFLFKVHRGPFPNIIMTPLNTDGRHRVTVVQKLFHPDRFEGDYCLTIQSDGVAPPELIPTRTVE